MDYTTLQQVHYAMHSQTTAVVDDGLLSTLITAASRVVDHMCTGVSDGSSDNYFQTAVVTGEVLNAQVNSDGNVVCYPHKPIVQSVQSFVYYKDITQTMNAVATNLIDINGIKVTAYPTNMNLNYPCKCRVTISYTGGLSGSTAGLPLDLIDLTTMLAIRFYREEESGLTDSIGVAELGQNTPLIYTKSFPVRFERQIEPYIRRVGWRYVT
jgi:hypothetical protein